MIGATLLSAALSFVAPECAFRAPDLQCQVCIAPFLLSCLPLAVAAVATALVVAVNSDSSTRALKGPRRPILDERGRAALVASLACVNYIVLFSEPNVESLLRELRPNVHAKGTDYAPDTVPEREISAQLGIRVAIVGDPKNHSTRNLLASIRKRADG